jgi:hypothetical protein
MDAIEELTPLSGIDNIQRGIFQFWIFEKQTSLCLFEQIFEGLPKSVDSNLIGAYLVTLSSFCEDLMGEKIDCVDSETLRIIYFSKPDFIFALLVYKQLNRYNVKDMLERLYYLFINKYKDLIGPNFDGDVTHFEDFADQIETIFNMKTLRFQQFLRTRTDCLATEITELFDFQKRREEQLKKMKEESGKQKINL